MGGMLMPKEVIGVGAGLERLKFKVGLWAVAQ